MSEKKSEKKEIWDAKCRCRQCGAIFPLKRDGGYDLRNVFKYQDETILHDCGDGLKGLGELIGFFKV